MDEIQELNQVFDNYIEEFKKLNNDNKRNEVIKSLKEFVAMIDYLAALDNIQLHYLNSREILDVENKKKVTEEDFLEAVIVYIEIIKNLIGEYLNKKDK